MAAKGFGQWMGSEVAGMARSYIPICPYQREKGSRWSPKLKRRLVPGL